MIVRASLLVALLLFATSLPLGISFLEKSLLLLVAFLVAILSLDLMIWGICQPAKPRRFHQVRNGLLRYLFWECQEQKKWQK